MEQIIEKLHRQLNAMGFKMAIVSIRHLVELESSLFDLNQQEQIICHFHPKIFERYRSSWDFKLSRDFPEPQSIITVAVPQPKVRVIFKRNGRMYSTIIPPTYIHDTDERIIHMMTRLFGDHGYQVCSANLPKKLLAVRSGLASYGRNNIAYIDGFGSYFRLTAYFSDIPCPSDGWREAHNLERCHTCSACMTRCPTNAICQDRFLIRAENCLTFFNEGAEEFPEWVDPGWHNCIVGCMICQDVCPENKNNKDQIIEGRIFSEEETQMILDGVREECLSSETIEKLEALYMLEYYHVLPRNLDLLFRNIESQPT